MEELKEKLIELAKERRLTYSQIEELYELLKKEKVYKCYSTIKEIIGNNKEYECEPIQVEYIEEWLLYSSEEEREILLRMYIELYKQNQLEQAWDFESISTSFLHYEWDKHQIIKNMQDNLEYYDTFKRFEWEKKKKEVNNAEIKQESE